MFNLGLKGGAGGPDGQGGTFRYSFHGDPHATFAAFFGGTNPFEIFFGRRMPGGRDTEDMEVDGDPFGSFTSFSMNGFPRERNTVGSQLRRKQDPPVIHELKVPLEEIYHGCTKRMRISRKRLNPDGRSVRTEDKILTIEIKRGWKEGTKITFPKEGDETPNTIPADIVFIIKDKPHSHFKRDGSNIIYPVKISLREVSVSSGVTQCSNPLCGIVATQQKLNDSNEVFCLFIFFREHLFSEVKMWLQSIVIYSGNTSCFYINGALFQAVYRGREE